MAPPFSVAFWRALGGRSIPSVVDGWKPGQRKILYSCFKRNLKAQIKVAQLSGYVAEHSAYHHGEQSLSQTIVGMAQNFPGANNINVLEPIGQFGTRLQGGKDAASARYVFTSLSPITRAIFPEHDDALLSYLDDDGQRIEPEWYARVFAHGAPPVRLGGGGGARGPSARGLTAPCKGAAWQCGREQVRAHLADGAGEWQRRYRHWLVLVCAQLQPQRHCRQPARAAAR